MRWRKLKRLSVVLYYLTVSRPSLLLIYSPLTCPIVALHPPKQSSSLLSITTSDFVQHPPRPERVGPLPIERRRRLIQLFEQAFPGGRVPADPFTFNYLAAFQDAAVNWLPFILATRITITNAQDRTHNPPHASFENVWCLWDTGSHISYIVTHQLDPAVRNNRDEGSAIMEISCAQPCICNLLVHANMSTRFQGVTRQLDSVIYFRPTLPNGVTFIILGQHVSCYFCTNSFSPSARYQTWKTISLMPMVFRLSLTACSIISNPSQSTRRLLNYFHTLMARSSELIFFSSFGTGY